MAQLRLGKLVYEVLFLLGVKDGHTKRGLDFYETEGVGDSY